MTKYCPTCKTEYQDNVEICPDDQTYLVDHPLPDEILNRTACDIYAAASEVEAERIVSFLRDEGIETMEQQTNMPSFPTTVTARYIITVSKDQKEKAIELVKSARNDGIISNSGTFLT